MKKIILPNNIAVIEDDSHLTKWVKECGHLDHDPNIQELCKLIPPGKVAIDVGAYIGDHTIAYLRFARKVVAFEPNPVAYECLCHNCPGAENHRFALGSKTDQLLWVNLGPNYGASYLTPVGPLTQPLNIVLVRKLDDMNIQDVGYIKVDVEGWEVEFLKGAVETIKKWKPTMVLEVNRGALIRAGTSAEELLTTLRNLGYALRGKTHPLQYDVIAEMPK